MTVACYLCSAAPTRSRVQVGRWLGENAIDPAGVEWYSDRPSSADRPALDCLEQDIAAGRVTAVVVWKLSDLVTRFRSLLAVLASWCERGVRVVAVSHGIDLGPEVRDGLAPLLRGLGEAEVEFRRERQRRGIAAAKARGVYPGRKRGTTKEQPRRAVALRGKGYTVSEIAAALGVSVRTAFRYLSLSDGTNGTVARKGAKP